MEVKKYSTIIGNTPLTIEIGKVAMQAGGSVLATYGGTTVLATATMSQMPREGASFFPLSVDFDEKYYAAGKIKGSRYIKRETRPSTEAILSARLIDRCIRPLFDNRNTHDVHIVVTVLSFDKINDPDVIGILATSIALSISDIPWGGPIGAIRINKTEKGFILNPTYQQREESDFSIVVAGKKNEINMIEAKGNEAREDDILRALDEAKKEITSLTDFVDSIVKDLKPIKREIEPNIPSDEIVKFVKSFVKGKLEPAVFNSDHIASKSIFHELNKELKIAVNERFEADALQYINDIIKEEIGTLIEHAALKEKKRSDGRKPDEIRELQADVGILPCPHGTGLFRRGLTQVLSVVTLGSPGDEEHIDTIEFQGTRNYMHHYNFPPFAPGETGMMRGPGRREIGHGALAEKAIIPVLPLKEDFPYTIRVVSEVLSSNGSTSMASVCGSTLALMDAGVPIKKPVAGIAMGLIYESEDNYLILTDIQGAEDHSGHMDFKVAGTKDGITELQMDVKVDGISTKILKEALLQAKQARLSILEVMAKTLPEPRKELPEHAPRILTIQIDPKKIREIIGSGGETINKIVEETNTKIDIDVSGLVYITAEKGEQGKQAYAIIENIVREYKVGDIVEGKVVTVVEFGAFMEVGYKKQGLVHVSELSNEYTKNVTDIVKVGDNLRAKIIKVDDSGKISLSVKALAESN